MTAASTIADSRQEGPRFGKGKVREGPRFLGKGQEKGQILEETSFGKAKNLGKGESLGRARLQSGRTDLNHARLQPLRFALP
jgi:hypothetical protein